MMPDEFVTRRGLLDDQRFFDLVGVTSLILGPNSTGMAMHVGHERAGWRLSCRRRLFHHPRADTSRRPTARNDAKQRR
jgi:hypothetical protein